MKNKETYELTITSKLEALPLPNLEDSIWSRIEAQLDIDMPTDDGGGGNAPAPKSPIDFTWFGGAALFCVTAILVSLFTLTRSNDRAGSSTTSSEEIKQEQTESVLEDRPPPLAPGSKPSNAVSNNSGTSNPNVSPAPLDSSTTTNVVLPPISRDSQQVQSPPPVVITTQKDTTPPKRIRGVRGISDSDYRIVPKKDST